MTITQQTTLPLDTTRAAGPDAHAQEPVAVQDAAQSGSGDPATGCNGKNSHPPEAIPQSEPAHRPFTYPAWPTSQPGPQATSPLLGQHPHRLRTDQMVYECYDQERGMPCVSPLESAIQLHRGRTYLPDASVQEVASEAESIERWLDDGGTDALFLHTTRALKA
ncbi:MAG TPA: hypothetical protein VFU49_03875 [Ktedonobacteraceae bacterium]|nr:hypothetical protein [Ktedonobacteraceae bacterium]